MTVTVLFTRSLAGAFRLGVQCPPADLIHFTKLTLSVIGTKWAPGSLIPFPIPLLPAQSARWPYNHSLGPLHTKGCFPFNSWEFYQTWVPDHSFSPKEKCTQEKGSTKPPAGANPAQTCRETQDGTLCASALDPVCGHPVPALCPSPLCLETTAINSLKVSFDSCLIIQPQIFLKDSQIHPFPFFYFQLIFYSYVVSLSII